MRRTEQGFTILEMLLATLFFTVGVLGLASGFLAQAKVVDETGQRDVIRFATQNIVEQMRREEFSEVAPLFGTGGARNEFWCTPSGDIWTTRTSDAVLRGQITAYDDESSIPSIFEAMATRYDLNGDHVAGGVVTDYRLLPMTITFETLDNSGVEPVEVHLVLTEDGVL